MSTLSERACNLYATGQFPSRADAAKEARAQLEREKIKAQRANEDHKKPQES